MVHPRSLLAQWIVGAVFAFGAVFAMPATASASAADNVGGWAWNADAGWISANSENCVRANVAEDPDPCVLGGRAYGLAIAEDGTLTGYAWSSFGWMCAGMTCAGSGGATPNGGWAARVNAITGEVTGWAKLLALGDRGWVSLSCTNTATCADVAYRTTVEIATGKFAGHAWSSAVGGASVGWIAWQPAFGGVTTTWNPTPRCSRSGIACAADAECVLPGEYCCLGGAPCGQCAGTGAACGSNAACAEGVLCCRPGVACGACVGTGAPCASDAACGGARGSCCPSGAVCTSDGGQGGGAGDGAGGGASGGQAVIGVCDGPLALCVDAAQCGQQPCNLTTRICSEGPARRCTSDDACGGTGACDEDVGIRTDIVRTEDDPGGGAVPCSDDGPTCGKVIGKCTDTERLCAVDGNCPMGESCAKLYLPWVETRYGALYSSGRVGSSRTPPPPAGKYNATYCILAGGQIVNFRSAEGCGAVPRTPYGPLAMPRFDVAAILRGRFGSVVPIGNPIALPAQLDGKVYLIEGDATIGATTIERGAGLVLVRGGNLTITGNVTYRSQAAANVRDLPSLGWLVLATTNDQGQRVGGNITIAPNVTDVSGAFAADGTIRTGTTGNAKTDAPLTVRGVLAAREVRFERLVAGAEGAERVFADGRAVVNPPPGFGDFVKALPEIRPAAP